jgi:hypothetical protein
LRVVIGREGQSGGKGEKEKGGKGKTKRNLMGELLDCLLKKENKKLAFCWPSFLSLSTFLI